MPPFINGLTLSRAFYQEAVAPILVVGMLDWASQLMADFLVHQLGSMIVL